MFATRYRPQHFDDFIGQAHFVPALRSSLSEQHIHPAYLFYGPRGCGKTTLARLVAKSLLCEKGISDQPCQSCNTCLSIEQQTCPDCLELDAASNTKVEQIRELLSDTQYQPQMARFRIYIIDEVHMLSAHSFNALLKTLEEPPEHVKFILATTERSKIPITVRSRTLPFRLQLLNLDALTQRLAHISKQEHIDATPQIFAEIARAAEGSLRDAITLFEQATSLGNPIPLDRLRALLGQPQQEILMTLAKQLIHHDASEVAKTLLAIEAQGVDYHQVIQAWQTLLIELARVQQQEALRDTQLTFPLHQLQPLAALIPAPLLQLWYDFSLKGSKDLPYAPTPAMGFEMLILRILAFHPQGLPTSTPSATPSGPTLSPELLTNTEIQRIQKFLNVRIHATGALDESDR